MVSKAEILAGRMCLVVLLVLMVLMAGCEGAWIGPRGSGDESGTGDSAGDVGGDSNIGGDPAGDSLSGDPISGDPGPGDPSAGDPGSGDPTPGDPGSGDPGPQRFAVQINGSTHDLYDFQVSVFLQGHDSSGASYVPFADPSSRGADIGFFDSDQATPLPFWIESWDEAGRTALVWVKVPYIPAAGTKTIYLEVGLPESTFTPNGNETFALFDDFESPVDGYFALDPPVTVMQATQGWELSQPHTMDVLELNKDGYRYWGYYGLQHEPSEGIGLARSNDLVHWDKYSGNPIIAPGRWAQVVEHDDTIYVTYTEYDPPDCTWPSCNKKSVLAQSPATDGIHFTVVEDIVSFAAEGTNPAGCLFHNPNDDKYYFYWHRNLAPGESGGKSVMVKVADSPLDLDDAPATEVLSSDDIVAAPDVLYHDGLYYLAYERRLNDVWYTFYYTSTSPTSGFVDRLDEYVLKDGGACAFHHVFDDTLYVFLCQEDSSTGEWSLDLRTGDLGEHTQVIDFADRWATSQPMVGTEVVAGVEHDGGTGAVLDADFPDSSQVIYSKSDTAESYVAHARVKVITPHATTGLALRYQDLDNRYTVTLREDLDQTDNLFVYSTMNGTPTLLGQAAVGKIDTGTWYDISVTVHETQLDVYFAGQLEITVVDSAFSSGRIGLRGAKGHVMFDDVFVRKHADPEPTAIIP